MVFSSGIFLFGFLPIVLLLYFNPWKRNRSFRNKVLLYASLFFYAWGEPLFVFLMLFSIVVCWKFGQKLETTAHKKRLLTWLIGYNVLVLFVFKYLTFVASQMGLLLHRDFSVIHITLPLGISFFTFQIMSYLFDVYYGKVKAQKSFLNVALYIALFPSLIAGPIVRYDWIAKEIESRVETTKDFTEGMMRFIYGLAKKVLIANYMGQIADGIFPTGGVEHAPIAIGTAWLGAIAYTLQIYFDFSGYSDMAIGLGRMFGFHFQENFRYPYAANSVTDFWRRWHISLSSWFRDYVYIPLGGNRVTAPRWVFNLFVVWALTGIWHGANWTFLIWGLFYFVLLLLEKTTGLPEKLGWFSHLYTMLMVTMAWVMFRSEDCAQGIQYIGAMWGIGIENWTNHAFFQYWDNGKWLLMAAVILSLPVYEWISRMGRKWNAYNNILEPVWALGLFLLSLIGAIGSAYDPFIYFNF